MQSARSHISAVISAWPKSSDETRQNQISVCVSVDLSVCVCVLPLQDLFEAGEAKFGTDEEKFVTILGKRSSEHLMKCEFVCSRVHSITL